MLRDPDLGRFAFGWLQDHSDGQRHELHAYESTSEPTAWLHCLSGCLRGPEFRATVAIAGLGADSDRLESMHTGIIYQRWHQRHCPDWSINGSVERHCTSQRRPK